MIAREPEHYAQYADGMPGGPDNPLGARALYLSTPERGDTFLRIHGTDAPATMGTAVSNGCARLVDGQIIDLYNRVPVDMRVVLYPPSWSGVRLKQRSPDSDITLEGGARASSVSAGSAMGQN